MVRPQCPVPAGFADRGPCGPLSPPRSTSHTTPCHRPRTPASRDSFRWTSLLHSLPPLLLSVVEEFKELAQPLIDGQRQITIRPLVPHPFQLCWRKRDLRRPVHLGDIAGMPVVPSLYDLALPSAFRLEMEAMVDARWQLPVDRLPNGLRPERRTLDAAIVVLTLTFERREHRDMHGERLEGLQQVQNLRMTIRVVVHGVRPHLFAIFQAGRGSRITRALILLLHVGHKGGGVGAEGVNDDCADLRFVFR